MSSIRSLAFWAPARFDQETVGVVESLLVIGRVVEPPPPPGVAEEDPEPVPTLAFSLVAAGDGFFLLLLGPEVLPPPPGVLFALALLPGGAFNGDLGAGMERFGIFTICSNPGRAVQAWVDRCAGSF